MQKLQKSDTVAPAEVAPGSIVTATIGPDPSSRFSAEAPRKARMAEYNFDLTEAEGEMITALRVWDTAQTSPSLRGELLAWDEIRWCSDLSKAELLDYMTGWEPKRVKAMKRIVKAARYLIGLKQNIETARK